MGGDMISLRDISKSYISSTQKREVLNNLTLAVDKGNRIAVMGPSGSGKQLY